jgi:hypothetical protein
MKWVTIFGNTQILHMLCIRWYANYNIITWCKMQTWIWMSYSNSMHFSDKLSYKILFILSYRLKDMNFANWLHVLTRGTELRWRGDDWAGAAALAPVVADKRGPAVRSKRSRNVWLCALPRIRTQDQMETSKGTDHLSYDQKMSIQRSNTIWSRYDGIWRWPS